MKSEHRHELKTNELAEWLSNFPQWAKENLRMIIYVSVIVVLVIGSYVYRKYQKDVVTARKQQRITDLLVGLSGYKAQILRSQAQGLDNSYMLIQTADDLQTVAQDAKNDQMAALALISRAEVLRMEPHYRLGPVTGQEMQNSIAQAKASYNEALEKASGNSTLTAMARFGLGICEEELGNFAEAEQIYRQILSNPDLEGTTAVAQAKERLETMADYKEKIVLREPPTPMLEEFDVPQVQLGMPEGLQTQEQIPAVDINLPGK